MIINTDQSCLLVLLDNFNFTGNFANWASLYIGLLNTYPTPKTLFTVLTDHSILHTISEPTFESSNTNVVKVDDSGLVTAVGYGTATVTVKMQYFCESFEVLYKFTVQDTVIDLSSINLTIGEKYQINTTSEPIIATNLAEDGYISIYRIDFPTLESAPLLDGYYYYSKGAIYKNVDNSSIEVTDYAELVEVNSPNIKKETKEIFSICFLKKCFVSLCLKVFDSLLKQDNCSSRNKLDTDLLYKRDLVWALLNAIDYLVEKNLLAEALRLLQRVIKCGNGLCSQEDTGSKGCGCSK